MNRIDQFSETAVVTEEFRRDESLELPRVYIQPAQPLIRRGVCDSQFLLRRAQESLGEEKGQQFTEFYNQLLHEFQPLIKWAVGCWDYLLSTEGCRFILRHPAERKYHRSPYRAFREEDFHRLVHQAFRKCVQEYRRGIDGENFSEHLENDFWNILVHEYQTLKNPEDPRQRMLTSYSYLRCIPYQFLNGYHHQKVYSVIHHLPSPERRVIELYYLRFFTDSAVAKKEAITIGVVRQRKVKALRHLCQLDFLTYCLLLQIERY